jgi:hypothetical protein
MTSPIISFIMNDDVLCDALYLLTYQIDIPTVQQ